MHDTGSSIAISVVIPVFNAERYLYSFIDNLKEQTLENLEFIFVDDSSTDRSLEILKEFSAQDARVRIIENSVNCGEGGSRNRGILEARGRYINSIDPDDLLAANYYELLYAKALEGNYDVVKGTRIQVDEATGEEIKPYRGLNYGIENGLAKGEPLFYLFRYEHQTGIFARHLFANPDVRYGTSTNGCDITFLLRVCPHVKSFAIARDVRYYYIKREGSATDGYTSGRSRAELEALREQIDALLGRDLNEFAYKYLQYLSSIYVSRFCHAIANGQIDRNGINTYIDSLSLQIARMPNQDALFENNWELKALLEEKATLPAYLCNEGLVWQTELCWWIDYLLAPESTYKNELLGVLPNKIAILARNLGQKKSKDAGPVAVFRFARAQLRQLPWPARTTVMLKTYGKYVRMRAKDIGLKLLGRV